jgi:hypothetical protein
MKKLIRNSTFETNSSSCHSISVSSNAGVYDTIYPNNDGTIIVPLNEFGWEQETYNDALTKLSYLMLYVRDWVTSPDKEKFMDMLINVVKEHTGASAVEFDVNTTGKSWNDGYIDHQSVEDRNYDYLFDEIILKEFLFGDGVLETDNDNH